MGLLRVRDAVALPERRLQLTLTDGSVVERDVTELLTGPVFDALRQKFEKFAEVRVEGGTVCWPDGADLCPDVLIWGGMPPNRDDRQPPPDLVLTRGKSSDFERSRPLSDSWFHGVVEVKPLGGHRLHLRFDDGAEGDIDLLPRLTFHGVFEPLRDPEYFAKVRIEEDAGTIYWPSEADIDPVVLYSWVTGKPLPDFGADAVAEDA